MDGRFVLEISLGNDAMRRRSDVARVLRLAAERIEGGCSGSGRIMDENGNGVGLWEFDLARDDDE